MSEPTPKILPVKDESELLWERVSDHVAGRLRHGLRGQLTVADDSEVIAQMAVTHVLNAMRVMSGRQLAVFLAAKASRHAGYVITEPPDYSQP